MSVVIFDPKKEMDTNVLIAGLIFGCPFDKEESCCPMKDIRLVSIPDRIEKLKRFTIEELQAIEKYHNTCKLNKVIMRKKENF